MLALAMLLSFAACGKKEDGPKDDSALAAPDSVTPEPEQIEDEQPPESAPPEDEEPQMVIPEVNPDLGLEADNFTVVNNVDEVLSRPHKIQPGTEIVTAGYDVSMYLPWTSSFGDDMFANIYEGLVYCYMGKGDDVRPLIAESWSVSDDYLTWTFKIRKGIKFTDGTVCDAAAVAEAWEYYHFYYSPVFTDLNIERWEAAGDELVVYLSEPCVCFESMVGRIYIVSPTALKLWGDTDNRAAVGTAPYYVSEYITAPRKGYGYNPGVEFIFKANPDYYLYERMPVIETVRTKIFYSQDERVQAVIDGEVDFCVFTTADAYKTLVENGYDGEWIYTSSSPAPLFLNAGKVSEFQIFEVRKAINRFTDLDALNDALYGGMGVVQQSIWSAGSSGEVPWPEGFYYDEAEGLELMAAAGIAPEELSFELKIA